MGLIDDQYKEINNHVRHVMQLLVNWYTFFVASNIVAIGWTATTDKNRLVRDNYLLGCGIVGVFIVVNLLGVTALLFIRSYFIKTNNRITKMVLLIESDREIHSCFRESPVPISLFKLSSILMILSLIALLTFWVSLLWLLR